MPNKLPVDPFTANDVSPKYTVGQVFEGTDSSGRYAAYKYVQFLDAVAYIRGHVCAWGNATGTAVTNDRSGGSNVGIRTAGICLRVMTQNYYGFVQVAGIGLCLGDGSVAAGESVVLDTGVDGGADTMAAGEEDEVFGMALEADDTANDPLTTSTLFEAHLTNIF